MGTNELRNMSDDEFQVNTGDAGAAATVSVEAGQIRKGGHIMIKGKACKVKDVSTSKTGKHPPRPPSPSSKPLHPPAAHSVAVSRRSRCAVANVLPDGGARGAGRRLPSACA